MEGDAARRKKCECESFACVSQSDGRHYVKIILNCTNVANWMRSVVCTVDNTDYYVRAQVYVGNKVSVDSISF